ncbi:MAG TPA: GNAT family N-acetyltransferase [Bryobacteraceae bacterium]|nr:GNAT family N-acetyltransferase [Bryobacteraceae bacterium]
MSTAQTRTSVSLRPAKPEDAPECGRICYEAFRKINSDHNFPPELPSPEHGIGILQMMFSHPSFYCVVAEAGDRIVGSNCLDERSSIYGIGPITIDPAAQNVGIGRRLMQAVMDRAAKRGAAGVRLVQVAFHNRSLSLYTKLGFDPRELLSVMNGPPLKKSIDGCSVRPVTEADAAACNQLCANVHGHTRAGELSDSAQQGHAAVVERDGRITGYTTGLGYFGHAVAESNRDLEALIGAAEAFSGPGILVPARNAALLRWCLENGLRIVQPTTLMTMGLYNEPAGAWLPSILF